MVVRRIDHVQLAMPAAGEDEATAFYEDLLGIPRVAKPTHLARRGGCWFERDGLKVHLGVDTDFRPARKAHLALLVDDLPALTERLLAAGVTIDADQPLDGYDRIYVDDPFGNRIELLEPARDITFRALRTDDLDMLVEWFAEPEVSRWWNQPADLPSVSAKYQPRIDGTGDPTSMWVAQVDGVAAGLLQSYLHRDYPDHDAVVGVTDAVGIDYLLAGDHRGRGLAGSILRSFAHAVFGTYPGAVACVATPARENRPSWMALERAGFVRSHECDPPGEPPAFVYVLRR